MSDEYDWTCFDEIYCINLYSRPDRYQQANEIFQKYKIPVKFYRTHKHKDGRRGCFESHLTVIRNAYDRGNSNVLIFEDDIIGGCSLTPANLRQISTFIQKNSDWNLFYLGIYPDFWHRRIHHVKGQTFDWMGMSYIYRIHSLLGHAYVVSRKMMKEMYNLKYSGIAPDEIYNQNNHAYGFCPSLFYQRGSSSDIENSTSIRFISRHSRYRLAEIYAQYINIPVLVLLPLLAIFLSLIILIVWIYTRKIQH